MNIHEVIQVFKECAEKYGIKFTVEDYLEYAESNQQAPPLYRIYQISSFNNIKKKLFGRKSLNRPEASLKEIKKHYKKICDREGGEPLGISEYGRKSEEGMVSSRVFYDKTTSDILKRWYKQKKRDEIFNTKIADKMRVSKKETFEQFCNLCMISNCNLDRKSCPYWNEKEEGGNK